VDHFVADKSRPTVVADATLRLLRADPKHRSYALRLTAGDRLLEMTANEAEVYQFSLGGSQPHEIVIQKITKNYIEGYLVSPKPDPNRARLQRDFR